MSGTTNSTGAAAMRAVAGASHGGAHASPARPSDGDDAAGDASDRSEVTQRFPELGRLDGMDYDQRIETFQTILDTLRHELDEERG